MARRARQRAAPAAECTWERFFESIACHEADAFPRILLFFPLFIGLVFGFVFTLAPNLSGAPGLKPAFAALGFAAAAASVAWCCAGAPVFRRAGCRAGCAALLSGHAAASAAPLLRPAVVVEGPSALPSAA